MDLTLKIKIISIPSLFLLCFLFGIFPYMIKKCRMNNSFLNYANTFSGGLFFGIGIFHLLSEGVEKLSKYSNLPIPYFLASLGYSFILFIQKVIFGYLVPNAENYLKKDKQQQMNLEYNIEGHQFEEEEHNNEIENIDDKNNENNIKLSLLIQNDNDNKIDVNDSTNTTRTTTADSIELKILQKKKLSGFIMLLALSIHGLFECLALGIQNNSKNTLFLFIALMIHKWAEAFSLGIFFVQAKLAKKNYYLLIIFFAIIGPIGVLLGIILCKTANEFIEGVFLCISTGTFLYVACSEVIVEEFSSPDKRYLKFFLYLLGTIFAAVLTLFEYLI
jgi:zinc transporter 1/2/3